MRHLAQFVRGPLPVKPQDGQAPFVFHDGVQIAEAVVIRNHFAATAKAQRRAIVAPHILLELAAVTPTREPFEPGTETAIRHPPAGGKFDVIPSREIQPARLLLLIEPPGRIDVRPPRTILVVQREVLQRRDLPREAGGHGIHDVLAQQPAGVGYPVRELRVL